jgi:uncharacterized protein DUF3592
MEPQWHPPHDSPPAYPPPPPNAPTYGPPGYGPPAYGPAAYGPPGYWPPPPQGSPWGPPAGPPVVWAVLLWGLAVVSLLGALVCGVVATAGFFSNSYLDSYGVTTTATVTHVQPFTDTVTVEFTTDDGASATAEFVWMTSDVPGVGEEIQITYDPDDPTYVTEAGSDSDVLMGVIYVVGAVIALAVMVGACIGAVLVHRKRGKAKRQRATW